MTRPSDSDEHAERTMPPADGPAGDQTIDATEALLAAPAATTISTGNTGPTSNQRSVDTGPISGVGSRFTLGGLLGEGGVSTVNVARDASLRRQVALKFLKSTDNSAAARFLEEAQITAQLQHPNIIPVYDLGVDANGRQFLAMKPVGGDEFAGLISEAHKSSGGRGAGGKLRGLLATFCKVCDAVAYAHNCGVIHRDLKPGNIMVGAFGEVLVMDWGLAKPIGFTTETLEGGPRVDQRDVVTSDRRIDGAKTVAGTVQGTPAYMAPEQALGGSSLDEGCDIYALGGILYTLLTGKLPIEGDTLQDLLTSVIEHQLLPPTRRVPAAEIPWELEAVVLKAMAQDRADRYASVPELKAEVEAYLDNRYVKAARYNAYQRLLKWVRRHPTAGVAIAMSTLMLAIASAGLNLYLDSERRAQQEALARADAEQRAAHERELAAVAREQAAAAREQTATARELAAAERERAAALESERFAAEQREREERLARLIQEEKFAELKRDFGGFKREFGLETYGQRDATIKEFIGAWKNAQQQGISQERFSASLQRNDVDRYLAAFERRFQAFRHGAVQLDRDDYFYYGVLLHLGALRYPEAIEQYDTVLKMSPDDSAALTNRGMAYYANRQYEQALHDQSRAVQLWPDRAAYWFNRGVTYFAMKRFDEAISDYRKVLELDDRNASAWLNLSNAQARLGRRDQALESVRRTLSLAPTLAEAHNTLGTLYLELGQNKDAISALSRAIELEPGTARYYSNRGRVLGIEGSYEESLQDLNTAFQLGNHAPSVRTDRAVALFKLGRFKEALADLDSALKENPTLTYALSTRAAVRSRMGDLTGGLADLNSYLALVPNDALALSNRCATHHKLGNLQQAFADADRAVELRPDDARMLSNRGDMHRVLGRFDAAKRDLQRAVELQPAYYPAWKYLGQTELALGNQQQAMAAFANGIQVSRERDASLFQARGEARESLGQLDAAAEDYLAAIRIKPAYWQSWHRLGMLRLSQDNRAAARQTLQKAYELCDDVDARGKIKVTLERLGVSGS